jgi:aryl-alcohol dehydrogenase (NADP+)
MAKRSNRDDLVIATKVGGAMPGLPTDLKAKTIKRAAEDSLKRLQTDHVEVYFAHVDDETTPLEESLEAFTDLVREGKILHIAASNYTAERLAALIAAADSSGSAPVEVLQPMYNLVEREFESQLRPICEEHDIATVPYPALGGGFLTGKYRAGQTVDSPRAEGAQSYLDERGTRVLQALEEIAAAHETSFSSVALAWLGTKPTVAAPIASARNTDQLAELLPAATLELDTTEIARLDAAGT